MIETAISEVTPVIDHHCMLGEGVIWNEALHMVSWVDIEQGEVHEYSFWDNKHNVIRMNQKIGAISLCDNDNYIAAMQNGIGFINRNTHEIQIINHPEAKIPDNRFNDGKCDPAGRFWAGTMSLSQKANKGSLYVLEGAASLTQVIKNVTTSNGMAWDTKRNKFYYIDTPTLTVASYDYNVDTGSISNKREAIVVPEAEGFPDGMTIDREGMLWIAHWDGWQVARWNPFNGEKLLKINLPVARPTSCAFGGRNMNSLFITSAKSGLNAEDTQRQPLAGCLFVLKNTNYEGLPSFRFKRNA